MSTPQVIAHIPVPHIAVIDPAAKRAEMDCFNRLVLTSPLPLTHHMPGLFGTSSLAREDEGLRGIVVLGSATSVHDDLTWQKELGEWLKQRLSTIPTLGICYGHQLIAHLYGAKVEFLFEERIKKQGFRRIELKKSRLWQPGEGEVFVSHREGVTTCPAEFNVIATSKETAIEGLEHSKFPIWTLQAHPESTLAFLQNVGYSATAKAEQFSFGHELVDKFIRSVIKRS